MTGNPGLPLLPRALDRRTAEPLLGAALAPVLEIVRVVGIRLLRCKPGRRAVVQYSLEAREPGGEACQHQVLGKLHHRGPDRTTFDLCRSLREAGLDGGPPVGVGVPEPLALVPELGLWLQRCVSGLPLVPACWGPTGVPLARRSAEALVRLHSVEVPTLRLHALANEIGVLEERLAQASQHLPQMAARIGRVRAACRELAAGMHPSELCGLHRDFYHDQLLIAPDRVWLLDLDLYARGDPALDVGNFIGHLVELGLRERGNPAALERPIETFRDHYLQARPSVRRPAVDAWVTLCLARHVELSTRLPGRRHTTDGLLTMLETRLGLAGQPRTWARPA